MSSRSIQVVASSPSQGLVQSAAAFLRGFEPFAQLELDLLLGLARKLELAYFSKGEVLIEPASGKPSHAFIVKQGVVEGERMDLRNSQDGGVLHMTPGEIFPVGALTAQRPVSTIYRAKTDVFAWLLPEAEFNRLMQLSAPFLDFCKRRMGALLDLSMQQQQARYASAAAPLQMMATPLSAVARGVPVRITSNTSIRQAFEAMQAHKLGSVLIVDAHQPDSKIPIGIFTRDDVIGRVSLPGVSLDAPIAQVMSSPVKTLSGDRSVAEAVLLMAEARIRHVPVVDSEGELTGIVTERDLFALQRQSLGQISGAIDKATTIEALQLAAGDLRAWSKSLVAQGIKPAWVTRLISRLNDRIADRILTLTAGQLRFPLDSVCWIALGSEGREEQTIATDQDNALILSDTAQRPAAMAFAEQVNQALDQCGYPLCKGGIMASREAWCNTLAEWQERLAQWARSPQPEALLNASIFIDMRPLAGNHQLAHELRTKIAAQASNKVFVKLMADNALRNHPPAAWTGGVLEQWLGNETESIDIKVQGSGLFVDAARVLALAHGLAETGTRARLDALAQRGLVPADEAQAWGDAFEFIQGLRLQLQHEPMTVMKDNPNRLDPAQLSELDRRILKEAFRQARKLQQKLALDFP